MVGLGVVIPTYGRVEYVDRLLAGLVRQRFDQPVDIVVVDDSPWADEFSLRSMCREYGVRYIGSHVSVPAKRNVGAWSVKGDVILFLDSDVCPVGDKLFEKHWQAYEDPSVVACQGLVTFVGEDNWLIKAIREGSMLEAFGWPLQYQEVMWAPSANFSVRRSAFEAIGGFDETIFPPPGAGGEDVDLCWRLGRVVTASHAVVLHAKETWGNVRAHVRRFMSFGRGDVALASKHPSKAFFGVSPLVLNLFLAFLASIAIMVGAPAWVLFFPVLFPFLAAVAYGLGVCPLPPIVHGWELLRRRYWAAISLLVLYPLDLGRLQQAWRLRSVRLAFMACCYHPECVESDWKVLWPVYLVATMMVLVMSWTIL